MRAQLDAGEAEAIALALEHPGSAVLLVEQRGRAYAVTLGVPVVGTFGVLIRAKREGLIPAVHPSSTPSLRLGSTPRTPSTAGR